MEMSIWTLATRVVQDLLSNGLNKMCIRDRNTNPDASELPIFPIMFVSIACGAISGFHAKQSPLMARCMTSERHGRPVFYGCLLYTSYSAFFRICKVEIAKMCFNL